MGHGKILAELHKLASEEAYFSMKNDIRYGMPMWEFTAYLFFIIISLV